MMGTAERAGRPGTAGELETMQAIVQRRYGARAADVLRLARAARPAVAAGEVLVRVRAAGVDRGTWHMMAGQPYLMRLVGFGFRRPRTAVPGMDVAGTVAAVGPGVTRFAVGDEVLGIGRGTFAEYAAAREAKLVGKPAGLGFEQAAVLTVSGLAALQGLRDAGRIAAGQKVLVIGASGGVGGYAVQLARILGAAEVTGVCGAGKADLVRSLGADHVIDYAREDVADGTRRYDLIMDINGSTPPSRLRRALAPAGTLVVAGGEHGGKWVGMGAQFRALTLSPFVPQRLTTFISTQKLADIEELARLAADGRLTVPLGRSYPLAQAPAAVDELSAGRARGKIAVTV
jgi:NADPH:quinone reductase-like Zn-dependent oxidoreductase